MGQNETTTKTQTVFTGDLCRFKIKYNWVLLWPIRLTTSIRLSNEAKCSPPSRDLFLFFRASFPNYSAYRKRSAPITSWMLLSVKMWGEGVWWSLEEEPEADGHHQKARCITGVLNLSTAWPRSCLRNISSFFFLFSFFFPRPEPWSRTWLLGDMFGFRSGSAHDRWSSWRRQTHC